MGAADSVVVELRETQSAIGERIDVGRLGLPAVAPDVRPAQVVGHDEDNVRAEVSSRRESLRALGVGASGTSPTQQQWHLPLARRMEEASVATMLDSFGIVPWSSCLASSGAWARRPTGAFRLVRHRTTAPLPILSSGCSQTQTAGVDMHSSTRDPWAVFGIFLSSSAATPGGWMRNALLSLPTNALGNRQLKVLL